MDEITNTTEKNFRISMKQTSKGHWHAEFGVRGNTIHEITERLTQTKHLVSLELEKLNQHEQTPTT